MVTRKMATIPSASEHKLDPRIARTRQAVLRGAAKLMVEKGITAFTVDEVVERTGVALSTIYRHWKSRDELLADTIVFTALPRSIPDTGSLRGDLIAFLSFRSRHISDHWDISLQTLPGIIEAGRNNDHIGVAIAEVVESILKSLKMIVERSQASGELPGCSDIDTVVDLLLGAIFIHTGYRGMPADEEYIESVVDQIFNGVKSLR